MHFHQRIYNLHSSIVIPLYPGNVRNYSLPSLPYHLPVYIMMFLHSLIFSLHIPAWNLYLLIILTIQKSTSIFESLHDLFSTYSLLFPYTLPELVIKQVCDTLLYIYKDKLQMRFYHILDALNDLLTFLIGECSYFLETPLLTRSPRIMVWRGSTW